MQRHRILPEKWGKVIEQTRKIEGFSNFLQAVPFSTLRTAAAEGPVILINISNYRDAIIIHRDIDKLEPPILVALPKGTPKHLTVLKDGRDRGILMFSKVWFILKLLSFRLTRTFVIRVLFSGVPTCPNSRFLTHI